MTALRDERLTGFVYNSLKQGIPLHQLEDLLDWRENVQPCRVAVMEEPVQTRPTGVPEPTAQWIHA